MPDTLSLFIVMFSKFSPKLYIMAHSIPDAHIRALSYAKAFLPEKHQEVVMVKAVVDSDYIITDIEYQTAKARIGLQSTSTKG
jgi:hypothetical protein